MAAALAVSWAPGPARAELEWIPEGRFFARYAFPIVGTGRAGPDANFELISGRLGTRVRLAPGISVRAVGEVLSLDPARRVGDLQLGYGEWETGTIGTLRLGQIPTFRDLEETLVGDHALGPGLATAAGFFYPSGLGLSWTQDFAFDFATASLDVAAMYTEGMPGSGALADNPLFPGIAGSGPAMLAHGGLGFPSGLQAHLFGRYGYLVDQQMAITLLQPLGDFHVILSAASSASTPQGLPAVADAGAMARVRYNLGGLSTALWRADLVGRIQAVVRNLTGTPQVDPAFPVVSARTDVQTGLALQYRVTDSSVVAVDLTDDRTVAPAATASLFLGIRAGVEF